MRVCPVVDPIPKARGVPRRLRDLDRDHALVLLSGARALIGTTLASGFGMTNDAHASITGRRSASRSLRSIVRARRRCRQHGQDSVRPSRIRPSRSRSPSRGTRCGSHATVNLSKLPSAAATSGRAHVAERAWRGKGEENTKLSGRGRLGRRREPVDGGSPTPERLTAARGASCQPSLRSFGTVHVAVARSTSSHVMPSASPGPSSGEDDEGERLGRCSRRAVEPSHERRDFGVGHGRVVTARPACTRFGKSLSRWPFQRAGLARSASIWPSARADVDDHFDPASEA